MRSNDCVVVGEELAGFRRTESWHVVMFESPVLIMPQFRSFTPFFLDTSERQSSTGHLQSDLGSEH